MITRDENLTITGTQDLQFYTISILGPATRPHANRIGAAFRAGLNSTIKLLSIFQKRARSMPGSLAFC